MDQHPAWSAYHRALAADNQKEVNKCWEVFYEGTSRYLRRFASNRLQESGIQRRSGGVIEADDVVQEAYRRLFVAKTPARDPKAWLHRVIEHIVSALARHEGHSRVNAEDYFDGSNKHIGREDLTRVSVPPAHEQAVELNPRRREVRRKVRALPERPRRLILSLYYRNVPRDELALCMGIKKNSVTQSHSRAIKLLGELLC